MKNNGQALIFSILITAVIMVLIFWWVYSKQLDQYTQVKNIEIPQIEKNVKQLEKQIQKTKEQENQY